MRHRHRVIIVSGLLLALCGCVTQSWQPAPSPGVPAAAPAPAPALFDPLAASNLFWTPVPSAPLATFQPVPIERLANGKSLRRKQSEAEFRQAYAVALQIVTPLAGLPREQQLAGIAQALRARFEQTGGAYSTQARQYNTPYGYLVRGVASCAGCTRATGLCLNILGIPYEHVNENKWKHQWCRVNVNGVWWISDAFALYAGPEPAPRKHPRATDA